MSEAADAVHRHHIPRARTRMTKRVVDGDARAHERPSFLRWQFIWNRGQHCCRRDHIIGISTVEIDACDLAINAHCEIAAPALFAHKTMSAVPAHADTMTS